MVKSYHPININQITSKHSKMNHKCRIQDHDNASIKALCLGENCGNQVSRLMCLPRCLTLVHKQHVVVDLYDRHRDSPLFNLIINANHNQTFEGKAAKNYLVYGEKFIQENMEKLNKRFNKILGQIQAIGSIMMAGIQSFDQTAIDMRNQKLNQADRQTIDMEANFLARDILGLGQSHLKDIGPFSDYVKAYCWKIEEAINQFKKCLDDAIFKFDSQIKDCCLYSESSITAILNEMKENANKKAMIQQQKRREEKQALLKKNLFDWGRMNQLQITQKWKRQNRDLNEIMEIDFSNGQIKSIPEEISCLRNASTLYLEKNQIKKIQNLKSLNKLQQLWLNNNQIKQIQNLQKLQSLEQLSLANNLITKIQSFSLKGLHKLKVLSLEANQIVKIQNLETLNSLQMLSLNKNKISKIQNLGALSNLKRLWLSENRQIKNIQNLQGLIQVEELQLNVANIVKIQNLEKLKRLTILSLKSNNISKIQNLQTLQGLTKVYLGQNPATIQRPWIVDPLTMKFLQQRKIIN